MTDVIGGSGNGNRRVAGVLNRQEIRLLGSQVLDFSSEFSDLRKEVGHSSHCNRAMFMRLLMVMVRMATSPAMLLVHGTPAVEEEESGLVKVLLMSRPRTCHDL